MTTGFRTRRLLAVAVVLLAAAVAAPRFLTYSPYARFGARLDFHTPGGVARVEQVVGPPALGLLEEGDLLRVVDGQPGTQAEFKRRPTDMLPRGPIQVTIERRGEVREITLPPVRLSLWQRVRMRAFSLAAVVAAPLVAFLLVWRRPDLAAAWAFLWFAVLQGLGVVWVYFRVPPGEPGPAVPGLPGPLRRAVLVVPGGVPALHDRLPAPALARAGAAAERVVLAGGAGLRHAAGAVAARPSADRAGRPRRRCGSRRWRWRWARSPWCSATPGRGATSRASAPGSAPWRWRWR